jgi:hypothetical protein
MACAGHGGLGMGSFEHGQGWAGHGLGRAWPVFGDRHGLGRAWAWIGKGCGGHSCCFHVLGWAWALLGMAELLMRLAGHGLGMC